MLRPQRTSPCHQWCHHVEQPSCYPSCTTTISTAIFTWSSPRNNWHEWTGLSQCFLALHHLQHPTHSPSLFHLLQIYTIPTKNTTSWTIDTENTFWSNYLWLLPLSKVLLFCCSRSTICLDQQIQIKSGTNKADSSGLCIALRNLFVTLGVPVEISVWNFFQRWGVRHRISSAHFPSSNNRAELAAKTTKGLLMVNVGVNGKLSNYRIIPSN